MHPRGVGGDGGIRLEGGGLGGGRTSRPTSCALRCVPTLSAALMSRMYSCPPKFMCSDGSPSLPPQAARPL